MRHIPPLPLMALMLGVSSVHAQSAVEYTAQYNASYSSMAVTNMITTQQWRIGAAAGKRIGSSRGRSDGRRASSSPRAASRTIATGPTRASFEFRASPAISRAMEEGFLSRTRKIDPTLAAELTSQLRQKSAIARFAQDVRPYGLNPFDLADTMAAYWVVMWMSAHHADLPTRQQVQGVQRQVHAAMAGNTKLLKAADAERQQLAEVYIYETELMLGLRARAQNPVEHQQVAAVAQSKMKEQGLDILKMKLIDTGFTSM